VAPCVLVVERVEPQAPHRDASAAEQVFGLVGLAALDAEGEALVREAAVPDLDAILSEQSLQINASPAAVAGNVKAPGIAPGQAGNELGCDTSGPGALKSALPVCVDKPRDEAFNSADHIEMGNEFEGVGHRAPPERYG